MKKVKVLGTMVDNVTMEETLDFIGEAITAKQPLHHVVVNAGKLVSMQSDEKLAQSVNEADLINADGQAVVWASKLLGTPLKERVAGIDLMENLVAYASKKGLKIFFFGAKEEVVAKVSSIYSEKYSPSVVAGFRNGYFTKEEEPQIAQEIANSGANILFVAISSPTKENFLFDNKELLQSVGFTMGVGGSFDVVSGKVNRAPLWMQNAGLEWFYRFAQEPKRMWKRYLVGNSKFIYHVLSQRMGKIYT